MAVASLLAATTMAERPRSSRAAVDGTGELAPLDQRAPTRPQRIVSLIPAVTEMLFAIGEGAARRRRSATTTIFLPEVARPAFGSAACSIRTSSASSLKPDLVIVYATQIELKQRLDRAGIDYFNYEHRALPDIMTTIRERSATGLAPRREPSRRRRRWSGRWPTIRASAAAAPSADAAGLRARSGRRCATSTPAAATGSFTTCWRPRAAATCSRTSSGKSVQVSTEMMLREPARGDHRALVRRPSPRMLDLAKELRGMERHSLRCRRSGTTG